MSKRIKTDYPGVFYREADRTAGNGTEKVFYVVYKKDGKVIEAKAGKQYQNNMTAAKAARYRAKLIEGRAMLPKEKREAEKAEKEAEDNRWTVAKLFESYKAAKPNLKGWAKGTYDSLYELHVKPDFGNKEPKDILPLDVKRVENRLLKSHSRQTAKHALKMLRALCNFGADNGLCEGLTFKMKLPSVNNIKTEDLTETQLKKLLDAIYEDEHPQAGPMMLIALYTGMRAGEMFRLRWSDIDFDRGFIHIRDPKGGVDQVIPLNDAARGVLKAHPKKKGSPFVFPGQGGKQRTRIDKATREIKKAAGLPADFRALHGLRHVYASMLASSGQVDMYVLQKLLTHRSPQMTQRYAHLRDEALKKASGLAGDIVASIQRAGNKKKQSA